VDQNIVHYGAHAISVRNANNVSL